MKKQLLSEELSTVVKYLEVTLEKGYTSRKWLNKVTNKSGKDFALQKYIQ
jgi:hypothetical protein